MGVTIVVATNNADKLAEFRRLITIPNLSVIAPRDLGISLEVAETGTSYIENARLKAIAFSVASGELALADDSGIELDDVPGWPGINSVRFAGPGKSDGDRRTILLERLAPIDGASRRARFVCSVAIARGDAIAAGATGILNGLIARGPRGTGGFGYDPIFIPLGESRTIAEMSPGEKDAISHRARALEAIRPFLITIANDAAPKSP
jgi:XTP/dITP diphosphohydrolase